MILTSRKNGLQFGDAEMSYLEELLSSIDTSLIAITSKADICESNFDKGEYFIGAGFCVMQRYLFDVLQDVDVKPHSARNLGPKSALGIPIAKLIHDAANYWKHSPEWHIWQSELKKNSQQTIDDVLHGRESADYPLSDLLADLCKEKGLSLISCLPYLIEWRLAVYDDIKNASN